MDCSKIKRFHIADIVRVVCEYFDVTLYTIQQREKHTPINEARQMLAYCLYRFTSITLAEVGMVMHRNHSSIKYAVDMVAFRIDRDKKIKIQFSEIFEKLQQSRFKKLNLKTDGKLLVQAQS